jgi:hypothetical protein
MMADLSNPSSLLTAIVKLTLNLLLRKKLRPLLPRRKRRKSFQSRKRKLTQWIEEIF